MLQALAHTFAQTYYTYEINTDDRPAIGAVPLIIALVVLVMMVAALWRIYTKAGRPGWTTLIPFYNTWVLLKIVDRPTWWLVLFFIPLVNVVVGVIVYFDLVKAFGKGIGMLLAILFLPFIGFPVLAFGNSTYTQPKRDEIEEPPLPFDHSTPKEHADKPKHHKPKA
jgi:ABC-type sulfate transport system permease subunit